MICFKIFIMKYIYKEVYIMFIHGLKSNKMTTHVYIWLKEQ